LSRYTILERDNAIWKKVIKRKREEIRFPLMEGQCMEAMQLKKVLFH
jgi:hypothetical protein